MTALDAPATIPGDIEAIRAAPKTAGSDTVSLPVRMARRLLGALVSLAVVLGAWVLFLKAFHVSHFIGKNPVDVWHYLFTSSAAGANRTAILHESLTTLRDAFIGLGVGTAAAVACAVGFNLSRPLERTLMPLAMVLRSVPLMAMTPVIVLIFGRDLKTVAVIAGVVTFFPALVNVNLALRRTPQEALDLCRAYGASQAETMLRVQIPSAVPALMASLRIAAPLALIGALLAEWLATGQGLGYRILQVGALSDYNGLWSRVALVTLYSVILYKAIGAAEKLVLARFAPTAAS
jgi:ABC-type nitrate/sulfonate/bicarbonate transport system permease component